MKNLFKRFGHVPALRHPADVDSGQPLSDAQSPLQRAVAVAFVACFAALLSVYWATQPVVAKLGVWWAEGLVYAVIPIAVTFLILHRSCWHREISGAARTGSLLLLSCTIFGGVLLAVGLVVSLGWFLSVALRAGVGGR